LVWRKSSPHLLLNHPINPTDTGVKQAIAAIACDIILCLVLSFLATGSTIACCLFVYGTSVHMGMEAAYFWIFGAILVWWRVTVCLIERVYGLNSELVTFFPIFSSGMERQRPLLLPGKRGTSGAM